MTGFILHQEWAKFHEINYFFFFFWPTGEEAVTAEAAFMLLAV